MAEFKSVEGKHILKPALSRPIPEARIQKRRASQARHRHNLAACFKNLHGVLPEQDLSKAKLNNPGQIQPDILQDAFSGIKTNRTMLLNRAKDYVMHLESIVGMLISESNDQQTFMRSIGASSFFTPPDNITNRFKSLNDVRCRFLKNFELDKSILDYNLTCTSASEEEEEPDKDNYPNPPPPPEPDKDVFIPANQCPIPPMNGVASEVPLAGMVPDNNSLVLIPINLQPVYRNTPMYVNAPAPMTAAHSPANISVDLGFVSAENASQGSGDAGHSLFDQFDLH